MLFAFFSLNNFRDLIIMSLKDFNTKKTVQAFFIIISVLLTLIAWKIIESSTTESKKVLYYYPEAEKINEISSDINSDGCIYCKSNHKSFDYSYNFCRLRYFLQSNALNNTHLKRSIQLMRTNNYMTRCPINESDNLFQYVSSIIQSNLSIFQEISLIETQQKIIYNKTNNLPPKWEELPIQLQNQYTFNNTITLQIHYFKQLQNENTHYSLTWSKKASTIYHLNLCFIGIECYKKNYRKLRTK